jgi:hypothetical protein
MIDKNELLIYTSDKVNLSDDYYALWEQIASRFSFVRYEYTNTKSKPLELNLIKEINDKYTNKYYSSKPDYKIIWNSMNECILINKTWEYGRIFIIPDYSTPHRYFAGFEYNCEYISSRIAGMIVYFDNDGNMIQNKKKIIRCGLSEDYDIRNGIINHLNSAFYKQTLIFTQSHRDTKNLIININLLDFNDNIICQSSKFTELKTILSNDYTNIQTLLKYPRFFHFHGNSNNKINNDDNKKKNIMIDLGSLKLLKKYVKQYVQPNSNIFKFNPFYYLSLDYYLSNSDQDNMEEFFEQANLYQTEEFTDGYPNKCVICFKKTSEAIFAYKNILMGLGNSFCLECQIRYSLSDKVWKCCKLKKCSDTDSIDLCSNKLSSSNNYLCDNLSHLENYRLNITDTNSNFQDMVDRLVGGINEYIGIFTKKKINVGPCKIK